MHECEPLRLWAHVDYAHVCEYEPACKRGPVCNCGPMYEHESVYKWAYRGLCEFGPG